MYQQSIAGFNIQIHIVKVSSQWDNILTNITPLFKP